MSFAERFSASYPAGFASRTPGAREYALIRQGAADNATESR